MSRPVHFLFYSRLEKEKGIDLLLAVMKRFADTKETRCRVSIFSDGSWKKEVEAFNQQYPNFPCVYYGRQPKREIFSFMSREEVDIVLMPSVFLETFGLNSGEALRHGIPVLGFKKGGTTQFILDDEWAIDTYAGNTNEERLFLGMNYFISTLSLELRLQYRQAAQQRALLYSCSQWKANFEALLSSRKIDLPHKRVLIVSDYKNIVGGIEAYVYEAQEVLRQEGYTVDVFGGGLTKRRVRKIGLIATGANIRAARSLVKKIKDFKPDLIYRNSVHRYLGWLPLWLGSKRVQHNIVFYHDFGLFHPFPSCVYDEAQLLFEQTFLGFFRASGKSLLRMPLLWLKYLSLRLIKHILQKYMTIHLVPSEYMVPIVKHSYAGETDVRALLHMIA